MPVLPDLLRPDLKLVFCGTAPSRKSAQQQAYYAHPGNQFWPILYQAGFIKQPLQAQDYPRLLDYDIGLTDVNKLQSGVDADLDAEAFDPQGLHEKILRYQPQMLAFTSKNAACAALEVKKLEYGLYAAEGWGETRLWVLPSTSGSARPHWARLHVYWLELGRLWQTGELSA